MILPSLALTVFIIGYPIVDLAWTSVHEVSRFGQLRGFDGLVNYRELVEDPLFVASLWRTLIWTFCVVGGALLIGLPVALILNEDFIGRGIARTIVMMPWAVSLTMTAVVWRWALNGRSGLLKLHADGPRPDGGAGGVAGDGGAGVHGPDPDRHPGLDPVHHDHPAGRPRLHARRRLRGGDGRRRDALAAVHPDHAAAAEAVPQHRDRAERSSTSSIPSRSSG